MKYTVVLPFHAQKIKIQHKHVKKSKTYMATPCFCQIQKRQVTKVTKVGARLSLHSRRGKQFRHSTNDQPNLKCSFEYLNKSTTG